jgi:hypothetical protein
LLIKIGRERSGCHLHARFSFLLCGTSSRRKRWCRSRLRGAEEKGEAGAMEEGEAPNKDDDEEVPKQCIFGMEDALEKFELT